MNKKLYLAICLMVLSISLFANDEKKTSTASLKSVTVYRTGAEMIHTASVSLSKGNNELIIEGISMYTDVNSIQVNCPSTVTILGVEFSNNYLVNEITSPVIKKLNDSLERINADIYKTDISITINNDLLEVLKSNKEIKGTQTGLSVAELMKLIDYYKLKSGELQNELSTLNQKRSKLESVAKKIRNQIAEEQKKNNKTAGRLILQLSAAVAGNSEFTLSYITQNAYWTPYYDIKATDVKSPLQITYKAKIVQTTGIDWEKVKLSLSTSTPSQYGTAPLLKSWFLSYINPVQKMEKMLTASNSIPSLGYSLEGKAPGLNVQSTESIKLRGTRSLSANTNPLYIVNGSIMEAADFSKLSPNSIASVDFLKDEAAVALYGSRAANGAIVVNLKDGLDDYVSVTDHALDVSYDIDIPYDVPSNGKQQIATLKETSIPAFYKFYSVPKLEKEVYLLAEVSEWEKLNLLPGEANIIFEGTYVGKSFIDPGSTSDTLNLTLGKDKRIQVKREKVTDFSSVKFLGTNKLQTITYDITVKNNKKDAVNLILKDQYPISTNKDIEVELLESSAAVNNTEIGVLTWQTELAPGESKKFRISYSAKYPKGKVLNLQ